MNFEARFHCNFRNETEHVFVNSTNRNRESVAEIRDGERCKERMMG